MNDARPSRPLSASATFCSLRILLLAATCLSPSHANAQARCTPADLDVTFRFGSYGSSSYIVVLLARNVTANACVLDTNLRPVFYALSQPTPLDIAVVADSEHPQPVVLDPSFTAHQTLRWQTSQAQGAKPCVRPAVLNLPVNGDTSRPAQIASPTLLEPVCSQVAFSPYAIGATFGDEDADTPGPTTPELSVTSGLPVYHLGESFILHVEAAVPGSGPIGPGLRCPTFVVRQRAFDGATRLEEYPAARVRCGRQFQPGASPLMTAAFDAVPPIQGNALGEASIKIMELTDAPGGRGVAMKESNAVTVHIIGEEHSGSRPAEELPQYDGWKATFTLTDTPFGRQSSLLDQTTHLEWLRLSATRNKSQEELRRAMLPHKALDGWRYATAEEVSTLFRHFTGTLSGRTTDPAVVTELQRLMGGAFDVKKITPGGWTRSITYGRIAGYYQNTRNGELVDASLPRLQYYYAEISIRDDDGQIAALADPHRVGGIDGDRSSKDTGTFLVREH